MEVSGHLLKATQEKNGGSVGRGSKILKKNLASDLTLLAVETQDIGLYNSNLHH
jgi:hypothetical protein